METIKRFYRVERKEISFLKFIIEAYEGLATLTTINPQQGLVVLRIAPDCEGEIDRVLSALGRQMRIEPQQTAPTNKMLY